MSCHWPFSKLTSQFLRPLSCAFCLVAWGRRLAYQKGWLASNKLPVPVIIVGNISVGGTGKTPLVVWLAEYWRQRGWHPGVLTRGYLGQAKTWPQLVKSNSDPQQVGDEAVLLARRCDCPVIASPKRLVGGMLLVTKYSCNMVLCDDGMQHYAMGRDLEIAVIDGECRFGNGYCLPSGPLREPLARLEYCDLIVTNGTPSDGELGMSTKGEWAINLRNHFQRRRLADFRGQVVIAIAGIGNPQRFFSMLRAQGLSVQEYTFPDHHAFDQNDLAPFAGCVLFMTEKDAVKCELFVTGDQAWYVPVEAVPDPVFVARLDKWAETL